MLTGPEIRRQRAAGRIVIEPWDEKRLNPNSYNLRLGSRLATYRLAPARLVRENFTRSAWTDYEAAYRSPGFEQLSWYDDEDLPLILDMKREPLVDEFDIPEDGYILSPGRLYLGTTIERTGSQAFIPSIEGRSSVARLGMVIHITASSGAVGFDGHWTLEIVVEHPLRVYAGVEVCQIAFTRPQGVIVPYSGKYQGQSGPQPSKLWKELGERGNDVAGVDHTTETRT